jgi:hypothetical protein
MKKLMLTFLIFGLISCEKDTYETVNLDKLLGKSVENFMEHRLFKNFDHHYYDYYHDSPDKSSSDNKNVMAALSGISFIYEDGIRVSLHLDSLKYTNLFGTWYFEDVKKETIQGIEIVKELPFDIIYIQDAWLKDGK